MGWLWRDIKMFASVVVDILFATLIVEAFKWVGIEPAFGEHAIIYVLAVIALINVARLRIAVKEGKP
jgi:hypothetical protein